MILTQRLVRAVVLFVALFTGISIDAQTLSDGLLAYYPFDGNATDATGHGFDGTTFKTQPTDDRFGNANGALAFDGDLAFVDCGNPAAFNFTGSFSIAAWVKLNGNEPNTYIVAKYDFGNSTHAYGLGTGFGSNPYAFLKGDAATFQDLPTSGTALSDGQWHFLAMVYNSNSGLALYQDGALAGSFTHVAYPAFVDPAPLQIGRTFSGQPFAGAIDDVRIYNRALTADEVAQLGPIPQITIIRQPLSTVTTVGARVNLTAAARTSGNQALRYQWFKNGNAIAGATNTAIAVTSAAVGEDVYKVQFTSGVTNTFSDDARIIFNAPVPAQLLAHYTFENGNGGIVPEESGRFPGVATSTTYVAGPEGARAIQFDGGSSVRIPYPDSPLTLSGSPYTIAFLIQTRGSGTVMAMGPTGDTNSGYYVNVSPSLGGKFQVQWMHGSGFDKTANCLVPSLTNWTHLALVWNGAARSLFVNGVLTTNIVTTNAISSDGVHDLFLGVMNGTNSFFSGILDDLRIYNYALASEEIQQIAATVFSAKLEATVDASDVTLQWPYDPNANFRVESATTLDGGGDWAPLSALPQRSVSGTDYTVIEPNAGNNRFFRLRKL